MASDDPRLDRDITLTLQGDWGTANIHRICGWIAANVIARSGPASRVGIWTGTGGMANLRAVADGEVDVSVATPACCVAMAVEGRLWGEPMPGLRALGVIPQVDRLVVALRRDAGITSFADWRAQRAPLRVATAADDDDSFVGYGARALLAAEGIGEPTLQEWGGAFVPPADGLLGVFDLVRTGAADAIVFEAIMLPMWQQLAVDPGLQFLAVTDDAARSLASAHGWPSTSVAAGQFPGLDEPLHCLEFSDFLVVCRDDLPDDVAHLIGWGLGETRAVLEAQYRHLPPDRSPVTYPLDPERIGAAPIPLHPGAARYYRSLG